MSEGGSGEPEREQDPWSQRADTAQPGASAAQPDVTGYQSAAPDSWSTTWAYPASPAPAAAPAQPGSLDGNRQELPPPANGFSPAGADPWPAGPGGRQATLGQDPEAAGQYGSEPWPAYPTVPRNNRVAIAALVCGLGQFVLGLLIVGNILLAIPAIICGAIGLKQTTRRGDPGRGIAIAGLVLGILGVVYFIVIVVVLIILASIHSGST